MTYEIKRLDLLSVLKISFLVYLVLGFLLGLLYGLMLVKMMALLSPYIEGNPLGEVTSLGLLGSLFLAFFMAFFFSIIWTILTVIAAAVYNLVAGWFGGVKLELATPPEPYRYVPPSPPPPPTVNP